MPLQFQDWTHVEESDGEAVHITGVMDWLGSIISEVWGRVVMFLTFLTSVLRQDNSRFTSSRSWPHWSDVAVLLKVSLSLLKDVISCLSMLISLAMKLLATKLYGLPWECEAIGGGGDTPWVRCSTVSGDADGGFLGWGLDETETQVILLLLSRSALLLFPLLRIVLGSLVYSQY